MSETTENFEQPVPDYQSGTETPSAGRNALVVNLEGFEGPIDLLLSLARDQKVDLTKISVLALAEQYLQYIQEAKRLRLEIAADYLVMAAWLTYLKSRLLLPVEETEGEEPTAAEMAAALQFQLQRLEAMRKAAETLFARPLLGRDVFPRGAPEGIRVVTNRSMRPLCLRCLRPMAPSSAAARWKRSPLSSSNSFRSMTRSAACAACSKSPDWATLSSFLPEDLLEGLPTRAAIAATFVASLELVRDGHAEIRQDQRFGPIYFRSRPEESASSSEQAGAQALTINPELELDERTDLLRLAEAVLFAAAEPLDVASIAAQLPEGTDVPELLEDLHKLYAGRGVNLVNVGGKWTLRTAPDLADRLKIERVASVVCRGPPMKRLRWSPTINP